MQGGRAKPTRLWLAPALVCLVLLAAGLILHGYLIAGAGGVATYYVDLPQLYVPAEAVKVVDARRRSDTMEMRVVGADSFGGRIKSLVVEVPLREGRHDYVAHLDGLVATSTIGFRLNVDGPSTLLLDSSVPVVSHDGQYPLSFWTRGMLEREGNEDVVRAKGELDEVFSGLDGPSELQRVRALADFVYAEIGSAWGAPDDRIARAPGLAALELVRSNQAELDCGPSSKIYAAYATLAGIPTRLVALMGDVGDVSLSRHTVAESWLSDRQQWVMVDLVSGVRFFTSSRGDPLDLQDVTTLWSLGNRHGLNPSMVEGFKGTDPFFVLRDYFSEDVRFFYLRPIHYLGSRWEKVWASLVQPKLAYALDSTALRGRTRLWTLAGLLLGMAALSLMTAFLVGTARRARA